MLLGAGISLPRKNPLPNQKHLPSKRNLFNFAKLRKGKIPKSKENEAITLYTPTNLFQPQNQKQ